MNYGLESSSGVRYDVQQQTYVQERDGMTYKLDKDTQQWIPLQSYTDPTNNIQYTFSAKDNTWIPGVSTYSVNDDQGKQQTYVWLKEQLKWELLSNVENYTDHLTKIKYQWNNETNSWDNQGIESTESQEKSTAQPIEKKKANEGSCLFVWSNRLSRARHLFDSNRTLFNENDVHLQIMVFSDFTRKLIAFFNSL